jgi:Glycosyl transferase family 2
MASGHDSILTQGVMSQLGSSNDLAMIWSRGIALVEPLLSTIFLSWNRPALLERTIESYAANTCVDHEVMLVDNASDKATKDVIKAARRAGRLDRVVFLRRNQGGRALNRVLPAVRGRFIHFSENDIEYWPGWDAAVIRKFEAFPELGQLSPFSPWPPAHHVAGLDGVSDSLEPLESNGEVIYEYPSVGTTCVVRHEVVEAGLRWSNIDSGRFRFPNDAQFSRQIRALGYKVARSDRYLVKNWGHNLEEMKSDVEYYLENYANKSWVGVEGLDQRLAQLGYRLVCEEGQWKIDQRGNAGPAPTAAYSPPRGLSGHRAQVLRRLKLLASRLKPNRHRRRTP